MLLLALLPQAMAWGHHTMMTDRSLAHPDLAWMDTPVEVQPLEALLSEAGPALSQAVDAHYAWLQQRGSERYLRQGLPSEGATRADFWRATRLNPKASLPLVLRVLPHEQAPRYGFSVQPSAASPYLVEKGGLRVRIEVVQAGQEVPARAVFSTFVDEPDWGLDHELWSFSEYGYGEQPYGKPVGESSKAPFHMQFDHENFLTVAFSDAEEGMVTERIDLFLRLSRASFEGGHDYWGLRFAAWAAHYAQDLTQPYHSRAIPGVGFGWYIGYVLSPDKDAVATRMTQIEANRHFVYEDFVATALQRGYLDEDPTASALNGYLAGEGEFLTDLSGAQDLVDELTAVASRHARAIDEALVASFPAELMDNADYDVETAPDYDISRLLSAVPAEAGAALLAETGQDFSRAGLAARTVLKMAGAREALAP